MAKIPESLRKKSEEEKKREREGREFIRQRERKLAGLGPGGVPTRAQREEATRGIAAEEEADKLRDIKAQEAEAAALRQQKGVETLQERGFFEGPREIQTEPLSLQTPDVKARGEIKEVPIAGPSLAGLAGAADAFRQGTIGPEGLITTQPRLSDVLGTPIEDPETERQRALQKIQEDVINKGIKAGELTGATIEAIPVVGGLAARYAGGLIESPSANAQTVFQSLTKMKEFAITTAEKAAAGKLGNPTAVIDQVRSNQDRVAELEARLKLLISVSPILQADPDTVNLMEQEILRTKNALLIAEEAAAAGLTGVGTASTQSLYLDLEELQNE